MWSLPTGRTGQTPARTERNPRTVNDTARLALIRAVLATFEANSEDDDGDRRLSEPGECIEAVTAIADETNAAPGWTAVHDGWLTTEAAAAILTAHGYADGR